MEDGVLLLMVDDARWTLGRSVGKHVLAEMMDGMYGVRSRLLYANKQYGVEHINEIQINSIDCL